MQALDLRLWDTSVSAAGPHWGVVTMIEWLWPLHSMFQHPALYVSVLCMCGPMQQQELCFASILALAGKES